MLRLEHADQVRQKCSQSDDAPLPVESGARQRRKHGLAEPPHTVAVLPVAERQGCHAGMGADRPPGALHEDAQLLLPCATGRGDVEVGQHQVDNEAFQVDPVVDVAVQRHGGQGELGGDRTHRQRGQAVAVDDGQGGGGDRLGCKGFGSRHEGEYILYTYGRRRDPYP